MLFEPTTLSTVAGLIAETLENQYATDARPVFAAAGLDYDRVHPAGSRYPWSGMQRLWRAAIDETGDPCFGLNAGRRIRPTSFHALGYSWLASETLVDSLQRLCRYIRVVSTAPVCLTLEHTGDAVILTTKLADPAHVPGDTAIDAFVAAILQLSRTATDSRFTFESVAFEHGNRDAAGEYALQLDCPVIFGAQTTHIVFGREAVVQKLPGDNAELARANDQISDRYLQSLEPHKVATQVREILLSLLPSGESTQAAVAQRMNRSLSTLQRQLHGEGTSYQALRDDTRHALAERYVADDSLTLSQIAYMLGFSDQSNFSRAFRRWTGQSPREFRRGEEG